MLKVTQKLRGTSTSTWMRVLMARTSRQRPVGQYGDPMLRMQQQIADLEARVAELSRNSRPTFPVYSPTWLDALQDTGLNDGEYWINSNNGVPYYVYNGQI